VAAWWRVGTGETERPQLCSRQGASQARGASGSGCLGAGLHGGSGIPLRCPPNPTQVGGIEAVDQSWSLPFFSAIEMQENHGLSSQGGWDGIRKRPSFIQLFLSWAQPLAHLGSGSGSFQCQKSHLELEEFRIQQRVTPRLCEKACFLRSFWLAVESPLYAQHLALKLSQLWPRRFSKLYMEVAQTLGCPQLNGCSSQGNYRRSGRHRLLCLFLSMPLQRTRLFSLLPDWLFLRIQLLPCSSSFMDSFFFWIAFLWDSG